MTNFIYLAVGLAAIFISSLRWLRVAQREHYLPRSTCTFALRWWRSDRENMAIFVIGFGALLLSLISASGLLVTAFAALIAPRGLTIRGRTSKLAWTRRLKTVMVTSTLCIASVIVAASFADYGPHAAVAAALLLPAFVDLALWILMPIESALADKYVKEASNTLNRVNPIRVAVTGSYGKTTIKGYVYHLVATTKSVIASPASFNNSAGLSRAVNENFSSATEVFVAEMGAYGPGEIRALCEWVKPSISILASIGPVHLERFGSLDNTVKSKAEIFENSDIAIINIDAYGLESVATGLSESGSKVIRCSAFDKSADVCVLATGNGLDILINGELLLSALKFDGAPTNIACSVAAAHALGVELATIAHLLPTLPVAEHRKQIDVSPSGITVIDDTYNSNPAGANAALETLSSLDAARKVLVTPGMVELGKLQGIENRKFGESAAQIVDDFLVVGRTNRAALEMGARAGSARLLHMETRNEAVAWVRNTLVAGDAVLYENDLPDHYF